MPTVLVSRDSERDLKIRNLEVYLDGELMGDVLYGQSLRQEVSPGDHEVKVTNRLSKKSMTFSLAEAETAQFRVAGIALGGLWYFFSMLGTVAYRVEIQRL